MKTITCHITRNILVSTSIALGVLTFVMLSGHFFRAFDLLSKGVAPSLLLKFLLLMIPDMLRFTLPLSILVATVLIFGRMSSDNEIVALKASGINLWQIIAPGLAICTGCSILCLAISLVISPVCRYEADILRWSALSNAPFSLLEPGVFTKLSNKCSIRVMKREGDDLEHIHIILQNGEDSMQDISAKRGRIHLDPQTFFINLELNDAIISDITFGSGYAVAKRHLSAMSISLPFDYGASQSKKKITRKPKFMDVKMLYGRMRLMQEAGEDITPLMLNLHHRLSLSLSPFAFLLLGIPFGIRGKRSELSVGLLICVILALGFYVFLLLAGMLEKKPHLHPELIVWLPNLLYQTGGLIALRKIGRH
ncbi:MAG: LptF/LptG family permease [Lentisphaeria bacterium]|nr:LptF/LptG family permease [Victivallales bacterium]MCR4573417.1 LptF/LptG family permease [Lentisphaeria bacterium]